MRTAFPAQPIVGVGAVIVRDGMALIVRRANDPDRGEWSIPGGRLELGESLADAVVREVREETGLDVAVGPMLEVFERVVRQDDRVRYHFVIVDYLCTCVGGALVAGDDAAEVTWVSGDGLSNYGVAESAAAVIRNALARSAHHGRER